MSSPEGASFIHNPGLRHGSASLGSRGPGPSSGPSPGPGPVLGFRLGCLVSLQRSGRCDPAAPLRLLTGQAAVGAELPPLTRRCCRGSPVSPGGCSTARPAGGLTGQQAPGQRAAGAQPVGDSVGVEDQQRLAEGRTAPPPAGERRLCSLQPQRLLTIVSSCRAKMIIGGHESSDCTAVERPLEAVGALLLFTSDK